MKNCERRIELLNCTLRDGGYINDNTFGLENIRTIIDGLQASKVDLIEYGYIEDKKPIEDDRNEYRRFEEIFGLAKKEKGNILMLLGEKYDMNKLPEAPNDDCYIRITFHKKHAEAGIEKVKQIIEKGYKVFIQPTATMFYSEDELVELLSRCNELNPVSVAIVDTFGQMTPDDVAEKVRIFDKTLKKSIAMSFHAHNNLQNAYANAMRFIDCVSKDRRIIVDSSIFGMGRGAGNLPTELIMGYLNKNFGKNYNVEPLLTVTDNVISKIKEKSGWGYSLPYYLSGIYGVHPSYILAFMERKTQNSGDIKHLIDMISDEKRPEFDADYANELYNSYNNKEINDDESKKRLKEIIKGKNILLIGPGKNLEKYKDKVEDYIEKNNPYIISINGKYDVETNAIFFSNKKRYENMDLESNDKIILTTSNINVDNNDYLVFDYSAYLAKAYGVSDNALLMFLNLLKSMGIKNVFLAGFDGYSVEGNFYEDSLELLLNENYINKLNEVIKTNLKEISKNIEINSITTSKYFGGKK